MAFSLAAWGSSPFLGFHTALAVLFVVSLAAAAAGVWRPALGLPAIGLLCALEPLTQTLLLTGGLLRWNTLNYWLFVVLLLSLPLFVRLRDVQSRLLQLLLVLIVLWLPFSLNVNLGVQDVLDVAAGFGILCYFARAASDLEHLQWTGLVVGVTGVAGGVAFYLTQDVLPYINPNAWSDFPLTALFAICIALHVTAHRARRRFILHALAAVNVAWVFLSGSRGRSVVGVLCVLFILTRESGLWPRLRLAAAGGLVALAVLSQFPARQAYMLQRLDYSLDSSLPALARSSGRSDLARAGLRIFADNPLGVGTGSYSDVRARLGRLDGRRGYKVGQAPDAHSAWIATLADHGLPGIVLLGSYVLSFALTAYRHRHTTTLALGLFVTLCLAALFSVSEFQGKAIWYLASAGTVLLHRSAYRTWAHSDASSGPSAVRGASQNHRRPNDAVR